MLDTLKEQFTGKLLRAAVWATDDPKSFFLMLAVCMTPFLLLSALLSWKLRGAIKVSLCSDFFFFETVSKFVCKVVKPLELR
ncbi:unnamed protein product [Gongylonema pulchrum]|uniref:Small integral membrane protein 15 n=1 Tax=Gongylonema pulchrum TaxID=637853 RepID=A0A183DYY6_9BILA|nr:unnamed protein product [Gongylonema pulchrum]